MYSITDLAFQIDDSLHVKREEIQKLEIVNQDLKNLNNICQFPNVLDEDLKFYREMQEKSEIDFSLIFNESIKCYDNSY